MPRAKNNGYLFISSGMQEPNVLSVLLNFQKLVLQEFKELRSLLNHRCQACVKENINGKVCINHDILSTSVASSGISSNSMHAEAENDDIGNPGEDSATSSSGNTSTGNTIALYTGANVAIAEMDSATSKKLKISENATCDDAKLKVKTEVIEEDYDPSSGFQTRPSCENSLRLNFNSKCVNAPNNSESSAVKVHQICSIPTVSSSGFQSNPVLENKLSLTFDSKCVNVKNNVESSALAVNQTCSMPGVPLSGLQGQPLLEDGSKLIFDSKYVKTRDNIESNTVEVNQTCSMPGIPSSGFQSQPPLEEGSKSSFDSNCMETEDNVTNSAVEVDQTCSLPGVAFPVKVRKRKNVTVRQRERKKFVNILPAPVGSSSDRSSSTVTATPKQSFIRDVSHSCTTCKKLQQSPYRLWRPGSKSEQLIKCASCGVIYEITRTASVHNKSNETNLEVVRNLIAN